MSEPAFTSWSYTRLNDFEKCPALFYGRHVLKLDLPGPALLKGRKTHEDIEEYLKSPEPGPIPKAFAKFAWIVEPLKAAGQGFSVEERIALDANWQMTDWAPAHIRFVLDVQCFYGDETQEVIDWKTGREYPSHADSARLYGLAVMSRYTACPEVKVRFVYLDTGKQKEWTVRRRDVPKMQAYWTARAEPLLNAENFDPAPGQHCRYCPFAKNKGGQCPYDTNGK